MLVKLYGNYSLSYLKEWVNFGDTAKCVYKAQVKHVEDIRLTSFFLNLFHFRRFEVIQRRIVIQILPFCCFFLALAVSSCRSFLICLPVYTPCHWVQSHQSNCPKSCFDHITPLPKGWHQRQSGPLSPQHHTPGSLDPSSFFALLPLQILTHMMPSGKNILSSHLISLLKPFLSFIALLMTHSTSLIIVAASDLFFLYASLAVTGSSQLALTTDCFVFSHLYFLVSLHFSFKQCESREFSRVCFCILPTA